MHQGIFIDIFPLDSVPDGVNRSFTGVFEMERLLWNMVKDPAETLAGLKQEFLEGKKTVQDLKLFLEISGQEVRSRFRLFEDFCADHFGETESLNHIMDEIFKTDYKSVKREWFRDTVYLPFEHLQVPAPADYEKILTQSYGDYHQLIQGTSAHEGVILEPDIPWNEYFAKYL